MGFCESSKEEGGDGGRRGESMALAGLGSGVSPPRDLAALQWHQAHSGCAVRWDSACRIRRQGCHSYLRFRPSHTGFRAGPLSLHEEPKDVAPSAVPALQCKPGGPQGIQEREKLLLKCAGCWPQIAEMPYGRNDFNDPRLLHLPMHRRTLNSLTWYLIFLT